MVLPSYTKHLDPVGFGGRLWAPGYEPTRLPPDYLLLATPDALGTSSDTWVA